MQHLPDHLIEQVLLPYLCIDDLLVFSFVDAKCFAVLNHYLQQEYSMRNVHKFRDVFLSSNHNNAQELLEKHTEKGTKNYVRFLLNHGSNLDYTEPFTAAVLNNSKEIVSLFLSAGAEVRVLHISDLAADSSKEYEDCFNLLLEHASQEVKDGALGLAQSAYEPCKFAKQLIDSGADPRAENDPLRSVCEHFVLDHGSLECIRILLQYGADPEGRDNGPMYALEQWEDTQEAKQLLLSFVSDSRKRERMVREAQREVEMLNRRLQDAEEYESDHSSKSSESSCRSF